MDDDLTSTASMTSVTGELNLSLDEADMTSDTTDTSPRVTASDCDTNKEGKLTAIYTPLLQSLGEQAQSHIAAVSKDGDNRRGRTKEHKSLHHCQDTNEAKQETAGSCEAKESNVHESQIPDKLSEPGRWYEHSCFNHYWRHYHFVSLWCEKQKQVYKSVVHQYQRMIAGHEAPQPKQSGSSIGGTTLPTLKKSVSIRTARNRKARRRRKAAKKRMRLAMKNAEVAERSCSELQSSVDCEEENSLNEAGETTQSSSTKESVKDEAVVMEFEMSNEMLDFFAHTHRHRQERDAKKMSKDKDKEEKRVNIEEVTADGKAMTEAAPVEQPGLKRTSEMRILYGKGAAMIHGMETALQMTFDRGLDVDQPRLWPNMPFRIVF